MAIILHRPRAFRDILSISIRAWASFACAVNNVGDVGDINDFNFFYETRRSTVSNAGVLFAKLQILTRLGSSYHVHH
jgi:hypothetical protein